MGSLNDNRRIFERKDMSGHWLQKQKLWVPFEKFEALVKRVETLEKQIKEKNGTRKAKVNN
mgnify:CR=1 FL=1